MLFPKQAQSGFGTGSFALLGEAVGFYGGASSAQLQSVRLLLHSHHNL
jgi:hypothetical protein